MGKKIAFAVLVIAVILGGVLIFKQFQKTAPVNTPAINSPMPANNQPAVQNGQKNPEDTADVKQAEPSNIPALMAESKVASVDLAKKTIDVTIDGKNTTLNITDSTVAVLVGDGKMGKMELTDIKAGMDARVAYDSSNNNIISITVIKN